MDALRQSVKAGGGKAAAARGGPGAAQRARRPNAKPRDPRKKAEEAAIQDVARSGSRHKKAGLMPGKRVQLDEETWRAIDLLGRDQMKDFQELADEAFRDLFKKHGRPVDLKDALRRSAGVSATVHRLKPGKKRRR